MAETSTHHAPRAKVLLAFAAIYIIWGSTYLAIKFAVQTIPPFFMAGARFLIAGTILYFITRSRGASRPEARHWIASAIVGAMLLLGGNGSLVWAERRVPSGLAALLLATISIWMVVLDSVRPGGARPGARVISGLTVGIAGLGLLVGPEKLWGGGRVDLLGAGVLMFGSFSWSLGSIYSHRADLPPSPFLAAAMEMLGGGALLILLGFVTGEHHQLLAHHISSRSIVGWVYLVSAGSLLGFTAYIWLLRSVPTSRVSTYAYVNPLVAVLLGWAFGGESLTMREIVAALAIVSAVALILSHQARPIAVAPGTAGLPSAGKEEAMGIRAGAANHLQT